MSGSICDCTTAACVLGEIRQMQTEERRARLRADYRRQLKARAEERDAGLPVGELWSRAQKAGAPQEALLASRGELQENAALLAAKEFVKTQHLPFLLLLGATGRGKTVAAVWSMLEWGRYFRWDSSPTGSTREPFMFVFAQEIAALSDFTPADQDYFEKIENARFVVIDELGEEGTDRGRERLGRIMLRRADNSRATVITGNIRPDMVSQRYGPQIADRFNNRAMRVNLSVEPKSLRPIGEALKRGTSP